MALFPQTLLVSAHLLHAAFVVEVAVGACDPEFGSGSKRVYSADCSPEKRVSSLSDEKCRINMITNARPNFSNDPFSGYHDCPEFLGTPVFFGCPALLGFHEFLGVLSTLELSGCPVFSRYHDFPEFLGSPVSVECPVFPGFH